MGRTYSARTVATLEAIQAACVASTGQSNVWRHGTVGKWFYEASTRQYADGRICGDVYEYSGRFAFRVDRFTIAADGRVTRGPAYFRRLAATGRALQRA